MDQKEKLIDKELSLVVVLPGGVEKMATVHGSKPLMDLLVTLCAEYHLNPSGHTLELVTTNRNNIKLKPNALIGTLDAEKIIIKPKGEDKNKKTGPQMPEATVRMVINYKQTQKTILRVNPRIPLAQILPAICEKCEFEVESTILLKDVKSLAPLDLSASLNDYAIREVYARDTRVPASPGCPASPSYTGLVTPGKDKNQKEKENKGLFSKFRISKKSKPEQATTASAPSSPVLVSKPRPLSMALPSTNSSPFGSPGDMPKKRRAPQPPILVSQKSCPSEFSPRQRLYSEPCVKLDSTDHTPALSRGSSTDSSLKRTKRKAPPPPSSPSVAPEALFPDSLQASTPANTLEEIKEQEEATSSATSTATSATQGEETTQNASPDIMPQAPQSTDTAVEMCTKQNGKDLSSDGNQFQSEVSDSANAAKVEKVDEDLTEKADTISTSGSVQVDSDTLPSPARLVQPQPVMQDAEAQASLLADSPPLHELADTEALSQQSPSTATQTSGEDAQVQTDFTPLPPSLPSPQQQQPDSVPSSPSNLSGKKDMATLTDDLDLPEPAPSSQTLNQDASLSTAKVPSEPEPKPKPSNELTRDYIPKVGMTTYTIVPQKSLEKLRYFEVALTLESPPPSTQDGVNTSSVKSEESTTFPGQNEQSNREKLEISKSTLTTNTTATTTFTNNGTVNEGIQEAATTNMSSTTTFSQAGSPTEVREIKIPPATKPKPGSFRLQQHKKTPGYYVTSAAEKSQLSLTASPGTNLKQGNAERAALPPPPPPPPPLAAAQCSEEAAEGAIDSPGGRPMMRMQGSVQGRESSVGLSLEKLRSFAAPRPYSPTTPSRFAQAVSSAVKRSQSLCNTPGSPRSPSFSPSLSPSFSPSFSPSLSPSLSPVKSQSPVLQFKEAGKVKVDDTEEVSTEELTQHQPSLLSGVVQLEGETHL